MDELSVLIARSKDIRTHKFCTIDCVYAVIELCVEDSVDVDVEN